MVQTNDSGVGLPLPVAALPNGGISLCLFSLESTLHADGGASIHSVRRLGSTGGCNRHAVVPRTGLHPGRAYAELEVVTGRGSCPGIDRHPLVFVQPFVREVISDVVGHTLSGDAPLSARSRLGRPRLICQGST